MAAAGTGVRCVGAGCSLSSGPATYTSTLLTGKYESIQSNCIYISREHFSLNEKLEGAGCLRYHPDLVLTKQGFSRSKWLLPPFFRSLKMTYHNEQSFKADYFQSVAQGQEFVIGSNEQAHAWAKRLIESNCDPADNV